MIFTNNIYRKGKNLISSIMRLMFLFVFLLQGITASAQKIPTIQTSDNKASYGTGTALSVPRPTNVAKGDLIVLIFSSQQSAVGTTSCFTVPSGFTLIRNEHDQSFSSRPEVAVYYKIAGDTEPALYTSTLTQYTEEPRWSALALRITQHDPLEPILLHNAANSGNLNTPSLDLPSLAITKENTLVVGAIGVRRAISNIVWPIGMSFADMVVGDGDNDEDTNRPTLFVGSQLYETIGLGETVLNTFSWDGAAKAAGVIFSIKSDITSADLGINATVSKSNPQRGEEIVFTITAKNNGTANATGTLVSIDIPAGYTYLSHTLSKGQYDPTTKSWYINQLANGNEEELQLTVLVTCSTADEHDLKLKIKGDQPDVILTNNEFSISVVPYGICPVVAVPDNVTVTQGTPAVLNVLDNDLLGDFDPTTFSSMNIYPKPSNGMLIVGVDGNVTYLPNGNFVGTDSFKYLICGTSGQCSEATVTITVEPDLFDVCLDATRAKTYYLPFPEEPNLLLKALRSAASQNPNQVTVRNILSIKVNYPKTVIVYDHWEDGYETDITNPQQSTTEIWGDGDITNGVAPGYPNDIIPAGGEIIIDKTFAYNRNQFSIQYDGKDKIYSTNDLAISKITGSDANFNVQNIKTDVIDITRFGKSFTIGFGEDLTALGTQHNAFKYVGAFIRASEDDTFVELDYDGDGIIDVTKTLNEGEVWLYDGTASTPGVSSNVNQANDIKAGARVIADKPVGVDIVFGGIDNYGTRNLYILPAQFYGSKYITPVHTTLSTAPVLAYFYNSSSNPVTINWKAGTGNTGNFSIPAAGMNFLSLAHSGGYSFESTNDEPFTAVIVVDADASGSAYDWAYTMVPTERLTNFASIAWAPGSLNLSANYNPIWVTADEPTTIYVKWDGDMSDKEADYYTPCGLPYDEAHTITALQSLKLYDVKDNDQSGAAVYTCGDDPVPFAAVWGQDANAGNPTPTSGQSLDVGYLMIPRCLNNLIVANDDMEVTEPEELVVINIHNNDAGYLCTVDPESVVITVYPENGTVEVNSDGTISYTPNPGFTGEDIFTYSVCALEYAGTCDDAIVTIHVRSCEDAAGSAGTNAIRGRVFLEQSPYDGKYHETEILVNDVKVNLYADRNCNGVVDSGEELLESTTTNIAGRFTFNTRGDKYARDEFPSNAYNSDNGTLSWSSNWSPSPATSFSVVTDALPNALTNFALRISGSGNISRSMNFSGATGAALSFKLRRNEIAPTATLDVFFNDNLLIKITDDIGTDLLYEEFILPITNSWIEANGNNTIRFVASNIIGSAQYYLDDVELMQFPTCFVVQIDPSSANEFYELGVTKEFPMSFAQLGSCASYDYLSMRAVVTAMDDDEKVLMDVPKNINVLQNDIGKPDPSTVQVTQQPANGIVVVNRDGTITYYPNAGFGGSDIFKYSVCSLDDPNVCDEAEVTINVACMSSAGKNLISGIVYGDKDEDGTYDSGEKGVPNIPVELYADINNNGLVDTGEPLVATVVTDELGGYLFKMDCNNEKSVKDEFSVNFFNENDGSELWASSWIKSYDNEDNPSIYINAAGKLRIQGDGTTKAVSIRRTADLTGAVQASLTYDYAKSAFSSSSSTIDFVEVEISPDGGLTWSRLKLYSGTASSSGSETFDISAFISPTTTIRIRESKNSTFISTEYMTFDNVEISYTLIPPDGVYVRDEFSTQTYDNNDGAFDWDSDWVEIDNNNAATGSVYINTDGKLRIQGDGLTDQKSLQRKVNLQNVTQATLIYSYEKSSFSHASNDWVDVEISLNGVDNWYQLKHISGTAAASGVEIIDIPDTYYGENSTIRIIEANHTNFSNTEYVLFDNFTIIKSYNNYIVKLKEPIPDGYLLTTSATIPVVFGTCGIGECGNNFGLNAADLEVIKTASDNNPKVGDNVVFTIKAQNNGHGNSTNIVIEDKLPNGYVYVSHTASAGNFNVSTGIWTIDGILAEASEELKITATVLEPLDASLIYLNTAKIISQDQSDPDLTNNTSSIEASPLCLPKLQLTKVALTADFNAPGRLLEYQLKVKNIGNVGISNIVVEDLKADAAPVYSSGDTNNNGVLEFGEEWIYLVEYTSTQYDIDFGYYKNTATASGIPLCGTLQTVEASAIVFSVAEPAFTLEKEAISGHDYMAVGDKVVYNYTLTNTGNVSLDYFTIEDDKIGTLPVVDIALPAGNSWTVSAEYTITQADIDARSVTNIAIASTKFNGIVYTAQDTETVKRLANNFWMGGTKDYENAWWETDNWTSNYIPDPGEDVEFATIANNGKAAVENLHLDTDRVIGDLINATDKDLVITTGNQLIINGEVIDTNASAGTIVIKAASDDPTGTLIFSDPTKNQNVQATVEFYNQAYECDDCGYYRNQWQYFGIPVKNADFPYLTPKVETVNQWVEPYNGDKWRPAPYAPDTKLQAFKGYEMTNTSTVKPTHIYQFKGELNVGDATVPLTHTPTANYPGMNLVSNSFSAALPISANAIVDANTILDEQTVYLFNTGTRDQWRKLDGSNVSGINAGRYLAVPFHLAGTGSLPATIPSMHSFMLNASASGNISLKYDKLEKTITDANTPVWRAKDQNQKHSYIVMDVIGSESADRVWLFEVDGSTTGFDNGWDGYKMLENGITQLYVSAEDNQNYQVASVPEILETTITLNEIPEENYQISFLVSEDIEYRNLYVHDRLTGNTYPLSDGAEYSIPTATKAIANRFKIVSDDLGDHADMSIVVTVIDRLVNVSNYSNEDCKVELYNASGKLIEQAFVDKGNTIKLKAYGIIEPGVYITKVTGQMHINKTTKVIIK